jgi:hypothetical protein
VHVGEFIVGAFVCTCVGEILAGFSVFELIDRDSYVCFACGFCLFWTNFYRLVPSQVLIRLKSLHGPVFGR